jgi:uncharacterized small protein (DUF1192 family)
MAIDTDDLFTPKPKPQALNLEAMGIAELEAYIKGLEAEIARAREFIAAKQKQRAGADALFKR